MEVMTQRWFVLALITTMLAWGEPAWQVSLGSSGGFTGGGTSLTVLSDGRVIRGKWSEAMSPRKDQLVRTMSAKEVQALKKVLRDPALVKLKLDEHANMTTFLNYQEGKVKRHYSWSMGKNPPTQLQRAYQAVESAGTARKI